MVKDAAWRGRWLWPGLALVGVVALMVVQLARQGRLWVCACGRIALWAGDIWSAENSQQLFDPYTFTHLLHGVAFFWLLSWLLPRVPLAWRLSLAIAIESAWEVVENAPFIINRYREGTAALGYEGDSILNSFGDVLMCGVGFMVAYYLGWRKSLALFIITDLLLLLWIRDGLILNIIMLIYPIEAIRVWQMGG